jgi:hypothetical protein
MFAFEESYWNRRIASDNGAVGMQLLTGGLRLVAECGPWRIQLGLVLIPEYVLIA